MNGAQHPGRQVSTIGVLSPVTLRARIAATLLALALVAAAALLARALPGDERGGGADGDLRVRVLSHGEEELAPAPDEPAGWPFPLPLAIEFFTDEFGPPPARWPVEALPVEFCTFQNNRPSSISAAQFRAAVAAAASAWNQAEAAVGVRYRGDCLSGFRWELDNERNEIGFDDSRNEITGTQAGVAIGGWFDIPTSANPERREFSEFDIVLDKRDFPEVPIVCFESTVTHEMGHALGFGHSDSAGDLMVPETDVSDPANCLTAPSAAERARLQELYGVDRAPTVSAGADRIVDPEAAVTLEASGSDPEGEALTFEWVQRSGPAVELSADGASVSFIAPAADEETLVFEVTAVDPLLHPATATVSVTVEDSERAPEEAPGLASFLPGPSGSAEIGWTGVSRTTRYEFCSHPPQLPALAVCRSSSTPFGASDWDLTLGSQGPETATRVFSGAHGGARVTSLRGCNSKGCSPEGVGPLAGGLRWPAWGMDFDYFAIALDFGTLRFTIAGVVNVSGPSRIFTITTGPVEEPDRELIRKCGPVLAGLRCIGFTGFGDRHFEAVSIVSTGSGTPTTEHQITVREPTSTPAPTVTQPPAAPEVVTMTLTDPSEPGMIVNDIRSGTLTVGRDAVTVRLSSWTWFSFLDNIRGDPSFVSMTFDLENDGGVDPLADYDLFLSLDRGRGGIGAAITAEGFTAFTTVETTSPQSEYAGYGDIFPDTIEFEFPRTLFGSATSVAWTVTGLYTFDDCDWTGDDCRYSRGDFVPDGYFTPGSTKPVLSFN